MQPIHKLVIAAAFTAMLFGAEEAQGYSFSSRASKKSKKTTQSGLCDTTEDCEADGYECVALQTTRPGAEDVKQCLPKAQETDICAGQYPGLCPSFSSWSDPYNLISSVCTYIPASADCAKDPSAKSVKGEVVCVPGAQDEDGNDLDVIYGCVDLVVEDEELGFDAKEDSSKLAKELDTVATVIDDCLNTKASNGTSMSLLCAGHGTCVPKSTGSLNYECRCIVGYSGDYCTEMDSNKCALPGQCSAGVCNLKTQQCECPAGTTGNQCADCDASSSEACNGNGQCSGSKCVCTEAYTGDHCEIKVPKSKSSKKDTADEEEGSGSGASSLTTPLVAVAVAIVGAVAMH